MSQSSDTNRIETGNILIESPSSGGIEIHDLDGDGSIHIGEDGLSVDEIQAQNSSGEQYAKNKPGDDLSTKVQNALDDLPNGQGRVRITPKADGTAWTWGSTLDLDVSQYRGLELVADRNCRIEYAGDGWCISVSGTGGSVPNTGQPFQIRGGDWRCTGDSAGWLQIQDVYMPRVNPGYVENMNSAGDSTSVSIENVNSYTESARIDGHYECDIGIDFVPGSMTDGDSGTESFHDTHLQGPRVNARSIGIRCRGWMQYSLITKPTIWLKAPDVDGIILDAPRMDGTVFTGHKIENVGGFDTGTGFRTTSEFQSYYGPTIVGGHNTAPTSMAKDGDPYARLYQLKVRSNNFEVNNLGNDNSLVWDGFNGKLIVDDFETDYSGFNESASFDDGLTSNGILNLRGDGFTPLQMYRGDADTTGIMAVNQDSTVQFRAISGDDVGTGDDAFVEAAPDSDTTSIPQNLSVSGTIQDYPQDVREISDPQKGLTAYHDPTINGDGNTEGPAFYSSDGTWVSQVDNSTIS